MLRKPVEDVAELELCDRMLERFQKTPLEPWWQMWGENSLIRFIGVGERWGTGGDAFQDSENEVPMTLDTPDSLPLTADFGGTQRSFA